MDYSGLLSRSWNIVWNNKWLILLGILAALGSGSGGGSSFQGNFGGGGDFDNFNGNDNFDDFAQPTPEDFGLTDEQVATFLAIGIPILIVIIIVAFAVSFVLWSISRVATG